METWNVSRRYPTITLIHLTIWIISLYVEMLSIGNAEGMQLNSHSKSEVKE